MRGENKRKMNKNNIYFSIIMPTYNRAFCIEKAIDSLLNQSYPNYELIIIDDGSTDATEQLIKTKYSKELENKKILYKKLTQNKGVCNARNIGLKLAQYDWIGYLDSDNEMLPDFLETFKNAISTNPNNKIFYSQFVRTDGTIVGRCFNYDSLLKGNFIDIGVFIHNKELVKQYGNFDTKLKRLVDWDLIIRYTKKEKPVFIEKVLLNYSNDNSYKRITNTESYDNALKKINKKQKNYLKHIFSITNQDIHKVVTLCGIKLKIKSKKLSKKKNPVLYLTEAEYPAYLKDWFYKVTGETLNLDNPQTFNEKIQWMKLYDSTPIKTRLADKYLVRDWVKEKIGEEYLIPLLGVWDKFEDIDFDKLPDKFALKPNLGSYWKIICTDKSNLDIEDARNKFDIWMHTNFAFKAGLELHYKNIPPKIVCEKYIESAKNYLPDYRFFIFGGEIKYIQVDDGGPDNPHGRSFYDTDWNQQEFIYNPDDWHKHNSPVPCPEHFDKMKELATILGKDFSFVRVDLYNVSGKIYFGEMTFTPCSGSMKWMPEKYNLELGKLIELPKNKE